MIRRSVLPRTARDSRRYHSQPIDHRCDRYRHFHGQEELSISSYEPGSCSESCYPLCLPGFRGYCFPFFSALPRMLFSAVPRILSAFLCCRVCFALWAVYAFLCATYAFCCFLRICVSTTGGAAMSHRRAREAGNRYKRRK